MGRSFSTHLWEGSMLFVCGVLFFARWTLPLSASNHLAEICGRPSISYVQPQRCCGSPPITSFWPQGPWSSTHASVFRYLLAWSLPRFGRQKRSCRLRTHLSHRRWDFIIPTTFLWKEAAFVRKGESWYAPIASDRSSPWLDWDHSRASYISRTSLLQNHICY